MTFSGNPMDLMGHVESLQLDEHFSLVIWIHECIFFTVIEENRWAVSGVVVHRRCLKISIRDFFDRATEEILDELSPI